MDTASGKTFGTLGLLGRGVLMGAADVVPGVSGGTIAFITGIYEELLDSIRSIDLQALGVLRRQGIAAAWQHINGSFLLTLVLGILLSVLTLANLISYLLEAYPAELWSFFFGLILMSAIHVGQTIKSWQTELWIWLVGGTLIALAICKIAPQEMDLSWPAVFGAGAVAICAMILPGISGSFILLIMGMYGHIIAAIKGLEVSTLTVFAAGCGIGLMGFSRLLSWLFHHYHNRTLATLCGFMLGSLYKVWPWKETLAFRENSHGEMVPLVQSNVMPAQLDQQVLVAMGLCLFGAAIVLVFDRIGRSRLGGKIKG